MSNLIPDGWVSSTLNEISKVSIGLVTSMTPFYVDNGVPLIRNSDIKENKVRQSKLINLEPSFAEKNKSRALNYRDVVTVHTGDIGTSAVIPKELDGCQGFATLNTRVNEKIIDPYYLCWFFNTDAYTIFVQSICTGDGRSNLNLKDFVKSETMYPPLPEQQKIAAILTSVNDVIEKVQAKIDKLKDLKTGMMQELLTRGVGVNGKPHTEFKDSPVGMIPRAWEVVTLGKFASLQRGHDLTKANMINGPYPVISSSGFNGMNHKFTTEGPGVVVGRKGSIGKVHYLENNYWAHDTSLYVTNFFGNDVRFVYYVFIYLDLQQYGTKSGSPSLNRNDIHPLKIALPPKDEQYKIQSILTNLDQKINLLESKKVKISNAKKALMQDLLTGKVRVKVDS